MKIIKKIISVIFNPLNSISTVKDREKTSAFVSKYTFFAFLVSLVVTATILVLGYFVL